MKIKIKSIIDNAKKPDATDTTAEVLDNEE